MDSIYTAQVEALTKAYYYKDSALVQSEIAVRESERIGQDYAGLYHESDKMLAASKKEVKRQKLLKWVGLGAGILIVIVVQ